MAGFRHGDHVGHAGDLGALRFAGPGAISKAAFIREHITDGTVFGSYGKEIGMFALFAAH